MKRTIRNNIHDPYSLHDMNVTAFEVTGDDIIMRTQSGMVKPRPLRHRSTAMWSSTACSGISAMSIFSA